MNIMPQNLFKGGKVTLKKTMSIDAVKIFGK